MASHQLLTRITGDPLWADRCEELAFNSLPASLDPSGRAIRYITSANSVDLDNTPKSARQFQNGFAMQAYLPGIDQYRCCPHNYGMGWPYSAEELWLATPDGGLAAAMYAACEVTAKVADGTEVTLTAETGYPFTDTVSLTVRTPKHLRFPLVLRIPAWCSEPEIRVNGRRVGAPAGPAFTRVERNWSDGPERVRERSAVDRPGAHGGALGEAQGDGQGPRRRQHVHRRQRPRRPIRRQRHRRPPLAAAGSVT